MFSLSDIFVHCDFSHSTSGIHLARMGPNTNFAFSGISQDQTCICNSTPMAEMVAAVQALRMEGVPALVLWDILLERDHQLQFMEDNTAMIRIVETGRNPQMRTIGRTHGINIVEIHERFQLDDLNRKHCGTDKMAADIYSQRPSSAY